MPAVELVVERMGFDNMIKFYKCQHALLPQFLKLGSDARAVLSALAVARKHFLALNVPDESKAARIILKDVCTGHLVHVMHPPGSAIGADLDLASDYDGDSPLSRLSEEDWVDLRPAGLILSKSFRTCVKITKVCHTLDFFCAGFHIGKHARPHHEQNADDEDNGD